MPHGRSCREIDQFRSTDRANESVARRSPAVFPHVAGAGRDGRERRAVGSRRRNTVGNRSERIIPCPECHPERSPSASKRAERTPATWQASPAPRPPAPVGWSTGGRDRRRHPRHTAAPAGDLEPHAPQHRPGPPRPRRQGTHPRPAPGLRRRRRAPALPGRGRRPRDEPARALRRRLHPGGDPRRHPAGAAPPAGCLLSPAGERLAPRAKAVLTEVGSLLEEAEAVRAPFTGTVRLGVIPTVAPYLLPTVLRLVRTAYPKLELQVHEEQTASLVEGLLAGRLDLLLLATPLGVPGLTELPLFDEDFVLLTPLDHPLGGREGVPREALREVDLLLLDEGHCLRDQALDVCRDAGRTDRPVTTSAAGLATLVQLVAGGLGVTLLPRTALKVEAGRSSQLLTGTFTDPAPSRRVGLVLRSGAARTHEYEELAAALREALRPLPVRLRES